MNPLDSKEISEKMASSPQQGDLDTPLSISVPASLDLVSSQSRGQVTERRFVLKAGDFERAMTILDTGHERHEKNFIFMTDGQMASELGDSLRLAAVALQKRFILVGLESSDLLRNQEYLSNHEHLQYKIHDRVFKQVIPGMVSELYAETIGCQNSVLLGFSNGASYVLSLALRQPDAFQKIIIFSPARDPGHAALIKTPHEPLCVYLAAGDQPSNRAFEKYSKLISKGLRGKGDQVILETHPYGHSPQHVVDALPQALAYVLQMSPRRSAQ